VPCGFVTPVGETPVGDVQRTLPVAASNAVTVFSVRSVTKSVPLAPGMALGWATAEVAKRASAAIGSSAEAVQALRMPLPPHRLLGVFAGSMPPVDFP
jgi:hypothetical protein